MFTIEKQKRERKEVAIAGISVSDITDTFSKSVNFDEAHRGVETVVDIFVVVGGGVAVEKVCGMHLKYSYNVCKIS